MCVWGEPLTSQRYAFSSLTSAQLPKCVCWGWSILGCSWFLSILTSLCSKPHTQVKRTTLWLLERSVEWISGPWGATLFFCISGPETQTLLHTRQMLGHQATAGVHFIKSKPTEPQHLSSLPTREWQNRKKTDCFLNKTSHHFFF